MHNSQSPSQLQNDMLFNSLKPLRQSESGDNSFSSQRSAQNTSSGGVGSISLMDLEIAFSNSSSNNDNSNSNYSNNNNTGNDGGNSSGLFGGGMSGNLI